MDGAKVLVEDAEPDGANMDRAAALLALTALGPKKHPAADALAVSLMQRRLPEGWEAPTEAALALLALTTWEKTRPPTKAVNRAVAQTLERAWSERAKRLTHHTVPFEDALMGAG